MPNNVDDFHFMPRIRNLFFFLLRCSIEKITKGTTKKKGTFYSFELL
jgi:hypothetical protein